LYDTLAEVYAWLVPEALVEPEGASRRSRPWSASCRYLVTARRR
jgi:hypothetical protein